MSDTPDLEAYREAHVRLNEYLGSDVEFFFAASATEWASASYIDPETGRPLDPWEEPESEIQVASIFARCQLVRETPTANFEGQDLRPGLIQQGEMWLQIPDGTYDPLILRAKSCKVYGETFRITRLAFDGMQSISDVVWMHCELIDALNPEDLVPMTGGAWIASWHQDVFVSAPGQTTFLTTYEFQSGVTNVYVNGVRMALGVDMDYLESGQSVVFHDPVPDDSIVVIAYLTGGLMDPSFYDGGGPSSQGGPIFDGNDSGGNPLDGGGP